MLKVVKWFGFLRERSCYPSGSDSGMILSIFFHAVYFFGVNTVINSTWKKSGTSEARGFEVLKFLLGKLTRQEKQMMWTISRWEVLWLKRRSDWKFNMCWFVETFFLVRWTYAMGGSNDVWFQLVQWVGSNWDPLMDLGNKKLELEPQKKSLGGLEMF